jgi:excinuclease Cho
MPSRPAAEFEYPSHIDHDSLAALPAKPGVYFFLDRKGVPLYIGKSINLRARVLTHLRTLEESIMLAETERVDFMRTAGEIGALLLESHMIKRYQPPYNVLLKFAGESFGVYIDERSSCPQLIGHGEAELSSISAKVHGLFASRSEAVQGLQTLVRQYQLCPALLGMEATTGGRACFAHQLGRCRGACIGLESREEHRQRLRTALERLDAAVWPYAGPIAIVERDGKWRQAHIIDRWSYAGTLEGRRRRIDLPAHPGIDIDTYKILAQPLAEDRLSYMICKIEASQSQRRSCLLPPTLSLSGKPPS